MLNKINNQKMKRKKKDERKDNPREGIVNKLTKLFDIPKTSFWTAPAPVMRLPKSC